MLELFGENAEANIAIVAVGLTVAAAIVGCVFFPRLWAWGNSNAGAIGIVSAIAMLVAAAVVFKPGREPADAGKVAAMPSGTTGGQDVRPAAEAPPTEAVARETPAPPPAAPPEPAPTPAAAPPERLVACDVPVDPSPADDAGPTTVVVTAFGASDLTSIAESVVSESQGLELAPADADVCAQDVQIGVRAHVAPRVENQERELKILEAYGQGVAGAPKEHHVLNATVKVEARLRKGARLVEESSVDEYYSPGGDTTHAEARVKERATRQAVAAMVEKILERR